MNRGGIVGNERGIAMMVVLLVALAVGAIALGAGLMSMNARAINTYSDRMGTLQTAADAGIELARARINGKKSLYPDSSYNSLEAGASVKDASGNVIPGLQRWTYVGPTGISTGQYGVFGSIVSVVKDNGGDEVVRRGEVYQESFAKFAYFTDIEGNIVFAHGDQIWGPVHSNDYIKIYRTTPVPQAHFYNTVETAQTIQNKGYAQFDQGYTEHGKNIPMPTTADLGKLQAQAAAGLTSITGSTAGALGQATTRIEFVAVDLNGDGKIDGDNEGFMRVYQATNTGDAWWVVGDLALNQFTVENYRTGSTSAEPCGGASAGRGCLYLTGGIIQQSRGPVGLTDGHGYIKRYAYDQCVLTYPPPYFPTTGHFARGRQFEVDPVGFDVGSYYANLSPHP